MISSTVKIIIPRYIGFYNNRVRIYSINFMHHSTHIDFNRSFSCADTSVCIQIKPYTVSKCPHPELLFAHIFDSLLSGVWYTIFVLIRSLRTVENRLYSVWCIQVCSNKGFLVLSSFQYKPHYYIRKKHKWNFSAYSVIWSWVLVWIIYFDYYHSWENDSF